MKKNDRIRYAIDESLSSVRWSANDTRSVLRAVRDEESVPCAPARRKRRIRFEPVFAAMLLVIAAVPLSIFAVRTIRAGSSITTITPLAAATGVPNGDPIVSEAPAAAPPATPAPARSVTKDDAILAARACFETQCDTSIFSFEEYTVSVQTESEYGSDPDAHDYVVTMNSVYDNGCSFTVVVSGCDGSVLSCSAPRLATVPTHLNAESGEIQAWYNQYGKYIFTWPLKTQAEFSRRYEGALLRMPREDEVNEQTIANCFGLHVAELTEQTGENTIGYYIMLCDGQSFADGRARYHVYCFPGGDVTDTLPDTYMLLTFFAADGAYESGQILSTDGL